MLSPELSSNHKSTLNHGWAHEGIFLVSGLIKLKSHLFSRGTFLLFVENVKSGLVSLGLWLEVLHIFFNITEHFGYEFCKYFTASAWLIWDQGGPNNLQDVILGELHCIFFKKCPCLFCFYKFFSLLGRDGKALRRPQVMFAVTLCKTELKCGSVIKLQPCPTLFLKSNSMI